MLVFMNKEHGNIHDTVDAMVQEAMELYDWGDPTNNVDLAEYYKVVKI